MVRVVVSLISEINQARATFMTEQQVREESSRVVDLSASTLPEDSDAELFTTTIESTTPESGFAGFGFSEALLKTLADKGYSDPSPIQKAAFPELMLGRDLVGQAQTGTGKQQPLPCPCSSGFSPDRKLPRLWCWHRPGSWRCRWLIPSRPTPPGTPT